MGTGRRYRSRTLAIVLALALAISIVAGALHERHAAAAVPFGYITNTPSNSVTAAIPAGVAVSPDSLHVSVGTAGSANVSALGSATSMTLASAPDPSFFGQAKTLTATVTCPGNTPTGTVNFFDGATFLGGRSLGGGGSASMTLANLSTGPHSLIAYYFGDANCGPSSSPIDRQTVNQASTTTTLMSAPDPSVFGQTKMLTATVTAVPPGAGTPSGTVNFFDGGTPLGGRGVGAGGVASMTISNLGVGPHSLTASYTGDPNFAASTSPIDTQTVNKASPSMATAAGGTVVLGSGAKLTDSALLSGGGNPTGIITFTLRNPGNVAVYTDDVTVNDNGTYTTATGTNPGGYLPTQTGVYIWSATYAGDTNNNGATDNGQNESEVVNAASPAVSTLAGGAVLLGSGTKLTDTAVLSGGFNPTGTITFTLQDPTSAVVYTDLVMVSGNGTYSTATGTNPGGYTPTQAGTYLWSATYAGDANNNGATDNGQNESEVVNPAADVAITKSGPATVMAGQTVTYTLIVTNAGPSDAQNVVVNDTLPVGETFVSASEGTGAGTAYTDTIGTLANGATRTITLVAQVSASAVNGATLTNTATVSSTTADPNTANNTARAMTTVSVPSITSCSANPTVLPRDGALHSVTVMINSGGAFTLQSVTSNDPIVAGTDYTFVPGTMYPAGTTSVSGSLKGAVGTGSHARQYVLTFVPAGPAAGTSCRVTVQVRLR